MNFNTVEFLFLFFPLSLALFYLAPVKRRLWVLSLSSLFFYGVSGRTPLVFMVLSIIWGYVTARFVSGKNKSKPALALAISFPLAVLFLFKYLNFTLDIFHAGESTRMAFYFFLSVILPAGISFYTFQIVSYSIDAYDGTVEKEGKLLRLMTYISFFPQLIAGPIVRYSQIKEQLLAIATEARLRPDVATGLKLFSMGLFGKIFFSDFLGAFLKSYNPGNHGNTIDALFNVLAYSMQIYYDFWAYSIMAIGLGKLFCIDLPVNFREPYLSENPKAFWRRWHITLSFWMRDYLYIRLGGNRNYVRNIIIVFIVVGIWHGAGWNFIVWGAYHALLILLYHFTARFWDKLIRPGRIALTFVLVSLGWPLFEYDLATFGQLMGNLAALDFSPGRIFGAKHWMVLSLIVAWTFAARESFWLYNPRINRFVDSPAVHAGLFFAAVLFLKYQQTFIYFRF